VVELGAGVGCTGLVAAGCCDAASVFLTDYTEACRINLEHNLQVNQSWLSSRAGESPDISQVGVGNMRCPAQPVETLFHGSPTLIV
jgi:hypothetical protein